MKPKLEQYRPRGLCFRCENRARNLETEGRHQPRRECGSTKMSVHTCYAYRPVKPVVLRKAKGDRRVFGYRTEATALPEGRLFAIPLARKRGAPIQWVRVWILTGLDHSRAKELS